MSIFVLLLLSIIPTCFALSNDTVLDESTNQDLLTDGNYYFNASAEDNGNGSKTNPYNTLTNDKLVENSIIYLYDGEYELNKGKTVNNISIVGQSTQNTILKFQNNNSILTSMESLTLQNLTLVDVSIINYGTLKATNVTFKNSVAYNKYSQATNLVNSASNSFGGAIYSPYHKDYSANVFIDSCTFINNTGEYGGAIYMYGGSLDIKNSIFLDNYAYNYGGAIACEYDSKVNIVKSKFINSKSINDAGGAIYLKNSKLSADNINISNSSATFGSAITSLSSTLTLNRVIFENNIVKYEGGAIYQFYGTFTLRNSHFINNSAKNGGALFIDNTTSTILYQNTFTNNTATDYAGAVYSLLNTKTRINYNEYFNNKAKNENDFYQTSTVSIIIGNGNYTMYKYNSNYSGALPSNYSSLANGYVTIVKDQQSGGNCWAFAGLAVLESCILKASGDNLDLSEENMKNLMELYSDYGWYMDTNNGGYPSMIMGYLVSWMGPVLEIEDINDDHSALSPLLNSYMHVQNIKYIERTSYTDNNAIKEAIMKYGAVGTGIYYDSTYFNDETFGYYGAITTMTNHAVTIVGWDDNYSRKNFINRPSGDGAFLVKNSWDTDWGNDGYFYVSYYDTSFARIGDSESIYTFILNDTVRYDKNYQYDIIGKTDYLITSGDSVWYQNIFNATDNEFLAAVSTYFEKDCTWDLYIYVNDALKLSKNGAGECGYYTIDLGDFVSLKAGDIFKVVFNIKANESSFPISEKIRSNKILYKEGISYFSLDGETWIDLYDYMGIYLNSHTYTSQVACIKAFTFTDKVNTTLKLEVLKSEYNPVEVVASVLNQYGYVVNGGNVTFNVYGKDYIVPISNGIAKISLDLKELDLSEITAIFNGIGYLSSKDSRVVNVSKIAANISFDISKNMTSANILINVSKNITEYLNVSVNDKNYTVKVINGSGTLTLNNLGIDNYTINAVILNETFVSFSNLKNFTIDVKNTIINASDLETYFKSGDKYKIILIDDEGNPLGNKSVIFNINGISFVNVTDNNGSACMMLSLENGEYNISCKFNGDENYFNCSNTQKISVKSTIILNKKENYLLNTNYSFILLNKDGNNTNCTNFSIVIDNKTYNVTYENGSFLVSIDLAPGKYSVLILNPLTGEKTTDNISIISRIIDNNDLNMYFGSGASYTVRILDDDGQYIGAGEIVKFTVGNKDYYVKTTKNGYASFKVNLNPKTYTVKVEYKGFKVSNKLVVKPVLTAKNISKKKSKTIKFSAKLVNTKGKVLKGKIIKFKFKGKTYKVRTNKKGIATVGLKNLKVGKYTIKTTYGKSTIKNTIKIRK